MAKRRQLLTSEDAVPATGQHTKPCSDCPWARASLKGWTGGVDPQVWLRAAHGSEPIDCHVLTGARCAGAAIYRGNVLKRPRPGEDLFVLPPDRDAVFAYPTEFLAHHNSVQPVPESQEAPCAPSPPPGSPTARTPRRTRPGG